MNVRRNEVAMTKNLHEHLRCQDR